MSDGTQSTNDDPRRHFEASDHVELLKPADTTTMRCRNHLNVSPHSRLTRSTSLIVIAGIAIVAGSVAAIMSVSAPEQSGGSDMEMASQTSAQNNTTALPMDYADVVQDAHTVKTQLDQERAARIAAEEIAVLAAKETEALKRAHAMAQTAADEERARLGSIKVVRPVNANLDSIAGDAATSQPAVSTSTAWDAQVSVSTAAPSASPEPWPQKHVLVSPIKEQPKRASDAKSILPQRNQVAEKSHDSGHSEILLGQKHLSAGNLAAARHAFERAAQMGRPEGALAVGNTFDPVSLAKIGLRTPGDIARARLWYRRAYDIAFGQQQKLAQQKP